MPTLNQYITKCRKKKINKDSTTALKGCPQKSAIVIKVYTTSPKKPNSAVRKVAKVRLSTKRQVIVGIPGIGHSLKVNAPVIIRGGRMNDVPGVRYKPIKGLGGFSWIERIERKQRRSKFGVKTIDEEYYKLVPTGPRSKYGKPWVATLVTWL